EIMSASEIRLKWASSEDMRNAVPAAAFEVYENEIKQGRGPVRIEVIESAILSRLRMMPQEYFETLPDANEGLGNRLFAAVRSQASLNGIIAETKTKRYAMSRIRRLIMCAALGVSADIYEQEPPYIRVLAANERGRAVLKSAAERAEKPIITKPAAVKKLDSFAQRIFEIEDGAANLYCLGYGAMEERRPSGEWRTTPYMK
ncbi:MAG: nucleotidyltransferase family protein, partial [Oscillospiraceae bacterium]|nr:nucleotidyltransferase family protein [Oscillospiraceae bacterium]